MSVDLYFTRDSFFFLFLSLFSSATLRIRWTELNQNWPHAQKWVQFENACPKSGVFLPSTNRGPKNYLFRRFRNLTESLTAYTFGTKHNADNRVSALTTTWGLLYRGRMLWNLVQKRLKTRPAVYPPSVHYAFFFIAGLSTRISDHRMQPNFATR